MDEIAKMDSLQDVHKADHSAGKQPMPASPNGYDALTASDPGVYSGEQQYYMAVDSIIFGFEDYELKLLIINRMIHFFHSVWKQKEISNMFAQLILIKLISIRCAM